MFKKSPALALVVVVLTYFALWLLVPKATFLPVMVKWLLKSSLHSPKALAITLQATAMLIMSLPTVVFMAIQIGIVYCFAKIKMGFPRSLIAFAVSLGCAYGLMSFIVWQSGAVKIVHRTLTFREKLMVVGNHITPATMFYFICIMFAAISLGYLVSLRIKDKNLLLPVVMFAAYIDFWTVTRGPVSHMMQNAPEVVGAVSTPIPHAGAGAFMPATMIGPGDFIFMALVFAVVHRFAMQPSKNYWFVFGAMTLGMLAVSIGLIPMLPALTVLAIAVVGANWRAFKLSREEKISTAIVGLLLLASLPIIWSLFKPEVKNGHTTNRIKSACSSGKYSLFYQVSSQTDAPIYVIAQRLLQGWLQSQKPQHCLATPALLHFLELRVSVKRYSPKPCYLPPTNLFFSP